MKAWKQFLLLAATSAVVAFVWWRFLPEPPLPDWLLIAVSPIVLLTMPGNAHGGEEMLGFLGIWVYVLVASVAVWGGVHAARRIKARAQI